MVNITKQFQASLPLLDHFLNRVLQMKKSRFSYLSEEEGGSEEDVGSGSYNVRAMPVIP